MKNNYPKYFIQLRALFILIIIAISIFLISNLIQKKNDTRSSALEIASTSKISFKIAFYGVKPESACLSTLKKVKVEVVNVPNSISQLNIETYISPVNGETNNKGD